MPVLRDDQFALAVTLDGQPLPGFWEELTGFDATAGSVKHRDADGKEAALGGPPSVDDGTVARGYDAVRDDYNAWAAKRGSGTIQVTARGKDAASNPYGGAIVYTGILQSVALGDVNRDGSNVRTITLGVSANSDIGG